MSIATLAIALAAGAGCGSAASPGDEAVRVAVASNFLRTAQEIATAFEAQTGVSVLLSAGSTGQLYAQIHGGAPFDVFLAADEERPARAEREGLAVPGTRFTYAVGRLVLFSSETRGALGPDALRDSEVRRIALANPKTAPYGRAAIETMASLGLADALADKQVIGANVAQAYQFVRTGNAELGFVALSQLSQDASDDNEGSHWLVPEEHHTPIRQQAVLLQAGSDNAAAAQFLDFLKSETVRTLLKQHGYRTDEW